MQVGLVEIIAMLSAVTGAVGYLFRALMAQKDLTYAEAMRSATERYTDMKEDRDFWRREHEDLQTTQVEMLVVVRDGVIAVREAVLQLSQQREQRGAT